MTTTKIEWVKGADGSAGMSWNALRAFIKRPGKDVEASANHCERVNEACRFCYAERQNYRLGGAGFKPGNRHLYRFEVDQRKLLEPLRRRKPTNIFVESMSDAFGAWWPTEYIDQLYAVMAICHWHTFINLSKRPDRRRDYLLDPDMPARVANIAGDINERHGWQRHELMMREHLMEQPLRKVIEGTSVSCQEDADEFVPILLATRCHRRVVSAEPLLGPIDFLRYLDIKSQDPLVVAEPSLHWIITGGESGDKARPVHPAWLRSIRDQCETAGIQHHFKQWGEWLGGEENRGQFGPTPMHAYRRCDNHSYEWPPGDHHRDNFGSHPDRFSGDWHAQRVGKKAAGRMLDGKEHNGFPAL